MGSNSHSLAQLVRPAGHASVPDAKGTETAVATGAVVAGAVLFTAVLLVGRGVTMPVVVFTAVLFVVGTGVAMTVVLLVAGAVALAVMLAVAAAVALAVGAAVASAVNWQHSTSSATCRDQSGNMRMSLQCRLVPAAYNRRQV